MLAYLRFLSGRERTQPAAPLAALLLAAAAVPVWDDLRSARRG